MKPVDTLPPLALSVRQPWAWAIIHGDKVIENRSIGSVRSGAMDCRPIAIHAASGMSEKEYRWAVAKLQEVGVTCPHPTELVRSAIIGAVDVVDIVSHSDSPWFGKSRPDNRGLVLENARACDPIPAKGALGYFAWEESGGFAPIKPWMEQFARPNRDGETADLFADAPLQFKRTPDKPY